MSGTARKVTILNRQRLLKFDRAAVKALAALVLDAEGVAPGRGVGVMFARDGLIQDYNRRFLQRDEPTDVISFGAEPAPPLCEDSGSVGDVVVGVDRAQFYARAHGLRVADEVARYVIHGILHCLGYCDATPGQRRRMQRREEQLLRQFTHRCGSVLRAA